MADLVQAQRDWYATYRQLADAAGTQTTVLRRRLAFLEEPSSFFYADDRPVSAEEVEDPFRQGVLIIARATTRAELEWLRATLAGLDVGV